MGRPKKLPKPIRNQPAIHRFLNSTEPETDKETDTDSEQEDDPSPQEEEIEVCTVSEERTEETPSDSDSDSLPDVDTLTVATRRLRVQLRKLPAKEAAVTDKRPVRRTRKERVQDPPSEEKGTSQKRRQVGRPRKDLPKPVPKEKVTKR